MSKNISTTIITFNYVYDIYSILTFQHGILFLIRSIVSILVSCNAHFTFYRHELNSHPFYNVKYRYLTLHLICFQFKSFGGELSVEINSNVGVRKLIQIHDMQGKNRKGKNEKIYKCL